MASFKYLNQVKSALKSKKAVVALESTVITHGLPYPLNVETAAAMESEVRRAGAQPATICLMDGCIHVGLDSTQLEKIASSKNSVKISRKDIAAAITAKKDGGTTVCGTMEIAYRSGIRVFATGGIGGVHRGNSMDVSADLPALSQIPMIVVCSGAKAILDLPATREYLETLGVPAIGYQTDMLPAFYSTSSGLPVDFRFDSPAEIARLARNHWAFGLNTAILVTVPPPAELAIPSEKIEKNIRAALQQAEKQHIRGSAVTPFLLEKVSDNSHAESQRTNIALLKNNAYVAGLIAMELAKLSGK
jgi:pseudouridine-5'-phosphate glycosidase